MRELQLKLIPWSGKAKFVTRVEESNRMVGSSDRRPGWPDLKVQPVQKRRNKPEKCVRV